MATDTLNQVAGRGFEGIDPGPWARAIVAQPSGLALDGPQPIAVAEAKAEGSAVRRLDRDAERVQTRIGQDLFEFGDRDGAFDEARLAHVMGLARAPDGRLFMADTDTQRTKGLDAEQRRIRPIAGTRSAGTGADPLDELGGLAD